MEIFGDTQREENVENHALLTNATTAEETDSELSRRKTSLGICVDSSNLWKSISF